MMRDIVSSHPVVNRKSSKERRTSSEVPTTDDPFDSSNGEASSPETSPEQKTDQKGKKQKKVKKNRQPRIIKSPPNECIQPSHNEEEILKAKEARDGRRHYTVPNEHDAGKNFIQSPRVEKTPSFKKKLKPEHLERLAREAAENKRSSIRTDSRERMLECNIVLLGDLGVGKTALAVRFVTRRYLHEYDPTLERTYEKSLLCSEEQVMVRLWDTVNKNWEHHTEHADGFLVMYSMTSSQSALNAQNIVSSIRSSRNALIKNTPILLVANKCELFDNARKVPREDSEKFALSHGCGFKEISVACTINVDGIIKSLITEIMSNDGGRTTPNYATGENGHHKLSSSSSLSRKPSNAKHIMKNLLSSKKKEKS